MDNDLDLLPWEQQPDESSEAFEAFARYRDDDKRPRSYRRVARELGKSGALISRWQREHGWVGRVTEYDRHLDRERRRAREKAIVEMAERQARLGAGMQALAGQGVSALVKAVQAANQQAKAEHPDDEQAQALAFAAAFPFGVDGLVRLADVGARLERLARGEPDPAAHLNGETSLGPAVDDATRAMVTDPEVQQLERSLVDRIAALREIESGRAGPGDRQQLPPPAAPPDSRP